MNNVNILLMALQLKYTENNFTKELNFKLSFKYVELNGN